MNLLPKMIWGVALGVFGCSSPKNASSSAGSSVFEIDMDGEKLESLEPAQLRASLGDVSLYDFWFAASAQNEAISVIGRLPLDQIASQSITLAMSNGPVADGSVGIEIKGSAGLTDLAGSTVRANVVSGIVTGDVTVSSTGKSWPFHGRLAITCWVPSNSLPNAPTNGGGATVAGALVNDETLSSPRCSPLHSWAM